MKNTMGGSNMTGTSGMDRPLECGTCTACCRSDAAVILMPPDDIASYDVVLAPAPDEMVQGMPEALFPIETVQHLVPPEILANYRKRGVRFLNLQLARRANGDCVYLGKTGCTIYGRRPRVCRNFDCRTLFLGQTRSERRAWIKSGLMSREVYAAGRKRTATAGAPP
jgi:Fe-S-cluster containining protein